MWKLGKLLVTGQCARSPFLVITPVVSPTPSPALPRLPIIKKEGARSQVLSRLYSEHNETFILQKDSPFQPSDFSFLRDRAFLDIEDAATVDDSDSDVEQAASPAATAASVSANSASATTGAQAVAGATGAANATSAPRRNTRRAQVRTATEPNDGPSAAAGRRQAAWKVAAAASAARKARAASGAS